jgi:hypothetical protein
VLAWTGEHTPIAAIFLLGFQYGAKLACGGLVISGRQQGRRRPSWRRRSSPRRSSPKTRNPRFQPRIAPRGEYLFSHAALARWGIQLPDDIARRTEWRP